LVCTSQGPRSMHELLLALKADAQEILQVRIIWSHFGQHLQQRQGFCKTSHAQQGFGKQRPDIDTLGVHLQKTRSLQTCCLETSLLQGGANLSERSAIDTGSFRLGLESHFHFRKISKSIRPARKRMDASQAGIWRAWSRKATWRNRSGPCRRQLPIQPRLRVAFAEQFAIQHLGAL